MQRVVFLPRHVAAAHQPADNCVLISIHDRSEPALSPLPGWKDVLYLRFHDVDDSSMGGVELFSDAMALQVLEFAARHPGCDVLYVHCSLGQSRSAAIAQFLSEKYDVPCFKVDLRVTWETNKIYNRLVYRSLSTADAGGLASFTDVMSQATHAYAMFSACHCFKCHVEHLAKLGLPVFRSKMLLCPHCGDKRCPHTDDHQVPCPALPTSK